MTNNAFSLCIYGQYEQAHCQVPLSNESSKVLLINYQPCKRSVSSIYPGVEKALNYMNI